MGRQARAKTGKSGRQAAERRGRKAARVGGGQTTAQAEAVSVKAVVALPGVECLSNMSALRRTMRVRFAWSLSADGARPGGTVRSALGARRSAV